MGEWGKNKQRKSSYRGHEGGADLVQGQKADSIARGVSEGEWG